MCFLVFFAYVFALRFGGSLPKMSENSLDVRFCFLRFVLSSLGFFHRRRFCLFSSFLFKRHSSGSNRTPHAPVWFFSFFFLSCRAWFIALLAVRPASWRFFGGAIPGPACFSDSLGTYGA